MAQNTDHTAPGLRDNAARPGASAQGSAAPAYRPSSYGSGVQRAGASAPRPQARAYSAQPGDTDAYLASAQQAAAQSGFSASDAPGDTVARLYPVSALSSQTQAPKPYRAQTAASSGRPQRLARAQAPKPKRSKHGCLSFFLWLIILATCALLAIRMIPASYSTLRFVPELASFVPLAFIPSAICFVLAVLWRRYLLILVSLATLVLNGAWHAGYFMPTARVSAQAQAAASQAADTSDAYARIMTVNTYNGMASAAQIVQVCTEQHVEILCLQEVTDGMVQDLANAGIANVLPYHVISDGASVYNNGGYNAIYTAAPMSNVSTNLVTIQTSPMPAADIALGNTTLRVVSVHPNSPIRGAEELWEEGLSAIGTLSNYAHAYIVLGDFNSTWDHTRFRELLGSTMVDASEQAGEGFHMTYPSNKKIPSCIEIDHIVYSKNTGITVSDLQTVTISGTDHKALLGTLEAK